MRRVRIKDPEHIRRGADGQPYGASQKAHDTETIPLCYTCHWNGVGSIYTRREFEDKFGNERDLLAQTLETLYNGTED